MFPKKQMLSSKITDFPSGKISSAGNPSMCRRCLRAEVHPHAKQLIFFSARPVFPVRLRIPLSSMDVHHGRCTQHSSQNRILQFLMRKTPCPYTPAVRRQWEPEGPETHAPTWYHSGTAFSEVIPQQGHPFSKDSKKGQRKQEWDILSLVPMGNSLR